MMTKFKYEAGTKAYEITINQVYIGRLYKEIDGFFVFQQDKSGFLTEGMLTEIAKELEKLNVEWKRKIATDAGL